MRVRLLRAFHRNTRAGISIFQGGNTRIRSLLLGIRRSSPMKDLFACALLAHYLRLPEHDLHVFAAYLMGCLLA